jgi:ubiquinone/menaquinone biosynthesis C-methylase UbiE
MFQGGDNMSKETDIKSLVQKQFGRTADKYVTSETHAKSSDLALLVEWLAPDSKWTTLDVATGGGHVAKALSPYVQTVFASDLTKTMLETAQKHLQDSECKNIHYVLADAEAMPFLDETFDAVTCRIAAHHFPNPQKFIDETSRVLKQNGYFVLIDNVAPEDVALSDYQNTFEKIRDPSHVRCPSISEWTSLLKSAGFELKNARTTKKTFQFDSWARRMVQSEEQLSHLSQYILSGSHPAQAYFGVNVLDEKITSLQIDQWMALAVKI